VSVLLGNGDGTFQVARDLEAGAFPVAVVSSDFNGDGRADVVVADFDANNLSVLINNTPQPGDGVTLVRGLAYYDGPDFNPQKHVLDVYLPAVTLLRVSVNPFVCYSLGKERARPPFSASRKTYPMAPGTADSPGHSSPTA
jgi:hypothetical protein